MAPSRFAVSDGFLLNQIVTEYQPVVISDRSINQFPPTRLLRLFWCPIAAWTTTRLIRFNRLPPLYQRVNPML